MSLGVGGVKRTGVAPADVVAVDDGLPGKEILLPDGTETLDALLCGFLLVPGIEFFEEAFGGAAGGAAAAGADL